MPGAGEMKKMVVLISSAICVRCFGLLCVPLFFVQLTSLPLSLFLSFPVCSPLSSSFCSLLLLPFLLSYALPSSVSLFLTFPSPSVFFSILCRVLSLCLSLLYTLFSLFFFSVSLTSSFSPFLSRSFLLFSLLLLSPLSPLFSAVHPLLL